MTETSGEVLTAARPGTAPDSEQVSTGVRSARRSLAGAGRFSGLFVWALVIVVFAIWVPGTFLTTQNVQLIAGDQSVTAMLAIGLTIPLAAGVFDLSCAAIMGFAVNLCAYLQVHHWNALLATVVTLAVSTAIGGVNGLVVVRFRVDSLIATLGMSSIMAALTYWITDGQQIYQGISSNFTAVASGKLFGIAAPFWYMVLLAAIVFVVLEFTPTGRYLYARGGNPEAARLAGLNTDRIVFGSLLVSALIAGLAGVTLLAKLGVASYSVGPPYLLAAFSAVFLGSTQITSGRVNVIGTLIAIFLLATGIKGLQLAGAPIWVNDLFNGVALIVAVALAARTARRRA